MAPPDENLVALVATVVSFAIVLPMLLKWWPKALPKPAAKRCAPAAQPAAPARPVSQRGKPRIVNPRPVARSMAASARPRRPS